jgi:hypothetical protein
MDKSQKLALILISAAILIGILVMVISGGVLPTVRQSTFRAAPGTQRDAARPFVTETAAEADTPLAEDGQAPELPDLPDASSERDTPEQPAVMAVPEEELSPMDRAILRAQNALNPQTGVERIEELLRSLENLAHASKLYAAKAGLHLRIDPPDLEGAAAAASEALRYAEEPGERDAAACVQIDVLRGAGDVAAAQEQAAQIMSGEGPVTSGKLRAALLYAAIKREAGDVTAAAKAYRDVMAQVADTGDPLGDEGEDLYRQAALNLVQTLREAGQREAADAAAEEFDERVARRREGGES